MAEEINIDEMFNDMDKAFERARVGLEGSLAEELRKLRSLDPEIVRDITPDTEDEAVYEMLIGVVQESSARNESQAQLASRIQTLGAVAVEIAKKAAILI